MRLSRQKLLQFCSAILDLLRNLSIFASKRMRSDAPIELLGRWDLGLPRGVDFVAPAVTNVMLSHRD